MRTRKIFLYLFLAGWIAGFICMNLKKSVWLENTDLWAEDMIRELSVLSLQGSALFASVLYRRGIRFLGISILATTYLGNAVCFLAAFGYGFAFGVYLMSAILRMGMRGILLGIAGIFPQGILYAGMMYGLLLWSRKTCDMIYGRGRRTGENAAYEKAMTTHVLVKQLLSWLLLLASLLAGCALECYISPALVRGIASKML